MEVNRLFCICVCGKNLRVTPANVRLFALRAKGKYDMEHFNKKRQRRRGWPVTLKMLKTSSGKNNRARQQKTLLYVA